ncbi:MAG TPA: ABC transporter permease [Vicinamibacteria bacterium]|nr:ABC transporter permease [Vicinamibacteria bacterium]
MAFPVWLEGLSRDLAFALRSFRRNPAFTAIAVLTLALGIGVDTAMFSVLDAVLLRELPYVDPGRLVTVRQMFPKIGELALGTSPAEYLDYRDRTSSFASVAGYEAVAMDLTGEGEPVRIQAQRVTHTLFTTLGVTPLAGRTFSAAEDEAGGPRVALVSYELWQRRFGASPRTVGQVIRLDEQPYTVVGIMPRGFDVPFQAARAGEPPAIWVPMAFSAKEIADRAAEFPVHVVARLRPGVSLAQAASEVERVAARFQSEHRDIYSGNLQLQVTLHPLGAETAARARPLLLTLGGAVVFVLLIACANVMNLLLSRATVREREMAVRQALGAGASRLARQLLTEALVLTSAGGVLGCLLAFALIRVMTSAWPSSVAGVAQARLDLRVLAFTVAVSMISGILCGLAPALRSSRPNLGASLKLGGRLGGSPERHRLRGALVVLEAASALVLLIGAGLLIHSFALVLRVPAGFAPDGVLIARTAFNRERYPAAEARRQAQREMTARLAALPGVTAVALTTHIPLADERQIGFILEGEDERFVRWADNALVSGDYFAAMGIPLVSGRTFGPEDTPEAPVSAIVNESMARRFFPRGDALGRRLVWGGRKLTIVGVAGDVHTSALDAAVGPMVYTPVYQIESGATRFGVFVVRTRTADPAALTASVRAAIWSVDRDVPVFDVRAMSEIVARSLATRRFAVTLLASFAGVALFLAVVGLYGVLSYAVTQRTSELGVRFALGATPARVIRMVLGDGLRLVAAGTVLGAAMGGLAARLMSGLLFGIHAFDVTAFAGAAFLLLSVALLASFVPARRASRLDPMNALRSE